MTDEPDGPDVSGEPRPKPATRPASRLSQWGWFVGLALASLACVAAVAYLLRGLLFLAS